MGGAKAYEELLKKFKNLNFIKKLSIIELIL